MMGCPVCACIRLSRAPARPKGKTAKQTHLAQKCYFTHFFGEPEASGHKSLARTLPANLPEGRTCRLGPPKAGQRT